MKNSFLMYLKITSIFQVDANIVDMTSLENTNKIQKTLCIITKFTESINVNFMPKLLRIIEVYW